MSARASALSLVACVLVVCGLVACGDDDVFADASVEDALGLIDTGQGDVGNDAGPGDDAGEVDSGEADSGAVDASVGDAAPDTRVDAGFGMSCEGTCAETRLEARFGDVMEVLDVAYFGFNGDETLRIEAYGGAADGCPEMDSPSPDRTLILGTLSAPTDSGEVMLTATLLDFEGTLTPEPFLSTPMAGVRAASALFAPLEMAFVRIDFDASFDGGTVVGAIYATHCASLDE
ncbi:MAG: hypothetical protein ACI9KE_005143 [Polyangiales bacterium]